MSEDKPNLPKCKVTKSIIERIKVVGPYESGQQVLDELFDKGFSVVRSGPYTDRKMHPTVDMTRFLFIAERPAN